jgi:hypothetical protein
MASFDPLQFLTQGTQRLQQTGAYGIPNIEALQALLGRKSEYGARRASAQDLMGLQRAGMGRSVAGAFSGGARSSQFNQSLMDALTNLSARHGQLQGSQIASMLGQALPAAEREANKPSWLSTLVGGMIGLGGQAFLPGLAGGPMGNSQMDLISKLLGLGQSGRGQGMASTSNFKLKGF